MKGTRLLARRGAVGAVQLAGAACVLAVLAGCSVEEALVDGVYGGISDTVAGAISGTLLALLGIGGG
ncbi:MAG: hypothetical protein HY718_08160 [Planctomycetes bacterium]|nr:hypothetical protein [Planctomycetota bacterium]